MCLAGYEFDRPGLKGHSMKYEKLASRERKSNFLLNIYPCPLSKVCRKYYNVNSDSSGLVKCLGTQRRIRNFCLSWHKSTISVHNLGKGSRIKKKNKCNVECVKGITRVFHKCHKGIAGV